MFSTTKAASSSFPSHFLPLRLPLSADIVGFRLYWSIPPCHSFKCLQSRQYTSIYPVNVNISCRTKCFVESTTTEDQLGDWEPKPSGVDDEDAREGDESKVTRNEDRADLSRSSYSQPSDLLSLGIPEPVYEVVEVKSDGTVSTKKIYRRHLLKSSGLRPRDIRSVDPSLWLTNSMPSLLVREHAILLNLGSLRAIVMQEHVLIFNYNRKGGKAFIDSLLPRLNPKNTNVGQSIPFVVEVVEAALVSRIQRLERRMMDLEPRVSMEA